MSNIKILHCADIHIGAELASIGGKARQRREEILMTFDNIVSICKNENIDVLLIAGDLFQSSNMDKDSVNSVKKSLKNIPDTIVAIAPGNHDYISMDSHFLDEDWPENVHIFKSELEAVEYNKLGLRLWGAAFTSTYVTYPMLDLINVPKDDIVNICVIHGELISENQQSNYNPISSMQLRFSGMDYVALGHIHKRTEILRAGSTYYSYCGCPEGQGFDELGEKGVYVGTVSKERCDLEFRPICKRMNLELYVDISWASTNNEASEIVLRRIKAFASEDGTAAGCGGISGDSHRRFDEKAAAHVVPSSQSYSKHLYKVILEGAVDAGFKLDCEAVAARLASEVYFIKLRDETHIEIDMEALSKEASLKGIFVRKMLDKINKSLDSENDIEAEKYRKALYLGLKAFDGEVGYNEN